MKYNIEVNEEQLKIIFDSVDLYSRLKCGQLKDLKKYLHPLEYMYLKKFYEIEVD